MRAVILAAGRGSRMGGLTAEKPKCMLEAGGKTLLQWQLEALKGADIEDIAIVRGYMAQLLDVPGVQTFNNERWSETNMVMSLYCARSWLNDGDCIVSYADIIYPADTIRVLKEVQGDIVIAYNEQWLSLWKERFEDPLIDAETFRIDSEGQLLEIGNKAENIEEIQGQYMGLLKFTPDGWRRVKAYVESLSQEIRDKLDMTSLLNRLLKEEISILTVPIEGKWYEFDSEGDLKLYKGFC